MTETLEAVRANYPGCIAEAALNYGEPEGDVVELTRNLEQIVAGCSHHNGESDLCLLAPVASGIGLVAVESLAGQWWLTSQITDAYVIHYPYDLNGEKVGAFDTSPECLEAIEVEIPVSVGSQQPAIRIGGREKINSLIYSQAIGRPAGGVLGSLAMTEKFGRPISANQHALLSLEKVVCAGFSADWLRPSASMTIRDSSVELVDTIDGLILHGNKKDDGYRVLVPEDRLTLRWPRTRTVEIDTTDEDITNFSHEF